MLSHDKYIESLEPDVKQRYFSKISSIGFDPYSLDMAEYDTDLKTLPDVVNLDIINYLLFSVSAYTQEQWRNYKSLEAYKYFKDGFVQQLGHKAAAGCTVVRAKVQLASYTYLQKIIIS